MAEPASTPDSGSEPKKQIAFPINSPEWLESVSKGSRYAQQQREWRTLRKRGRDCGPLQHWMKLYAEWRANVPGKPPQEARAKMASKLAGMKLTRHSVKQLEARDDFGEYLDMMIAKTVATYRAQLENTIPNALELRNWALTTAHAMNDYKSVAAQTQWIEDRLWPKKSEHEHKVTKVEVILSPQRQAALDDEGIDEIVVEAVEAEYEVIE